jgi:hypothetical protein
MGREEREISGRGAKEVIGREETEGGKGIIKVFIIIQ